MKQTMKQILGVLVVVLLVSACSPASAAQPEAAAAPVEAQPVMDQTPTPGIVVDGVLSTEFEDAANLRSQLAFGTLKLEGTDQAVSQDQVQTLLPLWQAMLVLSGNNASVSEEITAVQTQIVEAMNPEQLQAIADMWITNASLSEFYAEKGIVQSTPAADVTRVPGSRKEMSDEDKQATRTANEASGIVGSGTGQVTKTLLYDEVIAMLTRVEN
jgi:hypothetical protein